MRGADLVFACIGTALEVFSRYRAVEVDAHGLGEAPHHVEGKAKDFGCRICDFFLVFLVAIWRGWSIAHCEPTRAILTRIVASANS